MSLGLLAFFAMCVEMSLSCIHYGLARVVQQHLPEYAQGPISAVIPSTELQAPPQPPSSGWKSMEINAKTTQIWFWGPGGFPWARRRDSVSNV